MKRCRGYSLIELAIALGIVGLLASTLLIGLAAQREAADYRAAQRQLDDAGEALLGFAITYGRLPCPARPGLVSGQDGAGIADCPAGEHGVLPWVTLGLPETDPWGRRLTYYAQADFTTLPTAGALAGFELGTAGKGKVLDAAGKETAQELPAIIVSHGPHGSGAYLADGRQLAASGEEAENADADPIFVAHPPSTEFDDLVTWVVPGVLKARLVAVGRLP